MVADSESYSPSSLKPLYLANRLRTCENVEIKPFEPVNRDLLLLSHAAEYVDGVMSLKSNNGFGNRSEKIRNALPYIVGAEVAAATEAAQHRTLTWALCSGFHHANYSHGGGFCTFEGLTIAAQYALLNKYAKHVMIIDGDAHFGDGCVNAIETKKLSENLHYLHVGGSSDYRDTVEEYINEHPQTDLVLWQDGMDAYFLDPIGGGLTYSQLIERTTYIAQICKRMNCGLVSSLAGGYLRFKHPDFDTDLEPVLAGHLNAIKASASVYGIEIPELAYTVTGPWEKEST